jgi:hypothetical protein
MYYPTDIFETYRLLGLLGRIEIDYFKKNYLKEYYTKKGLYQELAMLSLDQNVPIEYVYFDRWLNNKDYESIKTYCEYTLGYSNEFPGEGEFLDVIKSFIPRKKESNNFILIANELEKNRFEIIKSNKNIDDCYNSSFEELRIIKNSSSISLFNPPYGFTLDEDSNSIRNVRYYLKMLLDRSILYNPTTSKDYKTGYIVCVIRKDDFLDSLDILSKNFDIIKNSIYKTNPDEYAKFKQYIFIAHLKRYPYDLANSMQAMDFQRQYNDVKEIILSEPEFKLSQYNTYQQMHYPYIDYDTLKENNKYIEAPITYISKNDSIWKWVKGIAELKNLGEEKLVVPKPLKLGEISNLLASGMINGEISLEDGKGKHVAIGGTKSIEKKEINKYKDDNGESITETKIIRMSLPYLNILCSDNGQLKIKELGGNE